MSDFTFTKDFFRIGDGCEAFGLPVESTVEFLSLGMNDFGFVGEELGRLKGDPVHPWKSRSDAWVWERRIWSSALMDQILQNFSLVDANIDDGRRVDEFLLKRLQEVDLEYSNGKGITV